MAIRSKLLSDVLARLARPVTAGVVAAVLLLIASGSIAYWTYLVRSSDDRQQVTNIAADARDALRVTLLHGLSATQTIEMCVEHGLLPAQFDSIAPRIARAYGTLDAIELAPGGIVSDVYPYEKNKRAIGFNILKDPVQKDEAILAVRNRTLIFAGPLELVQGGLAVVGRGPVFLTRSGQDEFWGFTIVIIHVSSLIRNAHLLELETKGFNFRLRRYDPISAQMKYFYNKDVFLSDPVTASIPVPNGEWEIEIARVGGSQAGVRTIPIALLSAFLSILAGIFVWFLRRQPERLKVLAERRATELFRSESRFSTLIEEAPVGIIISREGKLLYANPSFARIVGLTDKGNLVGHDLTEILGEVVPRDEAYGSREDRNHGAASPGECRMVRRADGVVTYVEMSSTPVELQDRPADVGFIIDVTERMRSEKRITDSLNEKVTLLKEVHHRVKNNLQVISSLLSIQATHVEDHRAREAYQDSIRRVRSMSLVHERLYRSADLSQIDFAQYLSAVTTDLVHSYHTPGVTVQVKADQIMLGLDAAIPCGLIANELVTNALKHAYADGRHGTVSVSFSRIDETNLRLEVSDDGVGLPEAYTVDGMTSMGMTIVRTLTDQIEGQLAVRSSSGASFTITFPG